MSVPDAGRVVSASLRKAAESLSARDVPPVSQLPARTPYHVREPDTDEIRRVDVDKALTMLIRLGELLLASGAGVSDVEVSVIAAASAVGLRDVEVAVTNNEIQVLLGRVDGAAPITRLRVVRWRTPDHSRLVAVHRLVLDLTDGEIDLDEAAARLETILATPRRYPRWGITMAWATLVAAVAVQLGGGWRLALITFATTIVIDRFGRALARRYVPDFYLNVVGASIVTMVAVGLAALDLSSLQPALVVAGGVVLLLPGLGLLTAVQDSLTGFVVTAAGRAIEVLVLIAGITTGVAATLVVGRQLGVVMPAVDVPYTVTLSSLPAQFVSAGIVAAMMAIGLHAPARLLPPAFVLGGVSYTWYLALNSLLSSPAVSRGVVAVAVGLAAALYGTRRRLPSLAIVVPGLTPLLPGLAFYAATLELTQGDSINGILGLLGAGSSALALAAGAILGDQLGHPLRRELLDLQRRRDRRRPVNR